MSFVRIALAGAGTFVEVNIVEGDEGDTISRLTKRVSAEFPHWGTADMLSLYLVAPGGDDMPSPSAVDSARHLNQIGWSLESSGVSSGAWLVARKIMDGGASFSCATLTQLSPQCRAYLLSPYSISHVAHSALRATHYWLTTVVLRVGDSLLSAAPGTENADVFISRWDTPCESRGLDGQEHDSDPGGHRMLNFGVDSAESGRGSLKKE